MAAGGLIFAVHINESASYDPSTQGAIQSIDYSESARTFDTEFNTFGGKSGPAIRQNGNFYIFSFQNTRSIDEVADPTPSPWITIAFPGIQQNNFRLVTGPNTFDSTQHPDFSAAGGEIHFGLAGAQSHTGGCCSTRQSDHDNWSMHVTQAPPPITMSRPGPFDHRVGDDLTLTATVVDSSGAPVEGAMVTFFISGSFGSQELGPFLTNADGQASITYTRSAAGEDIVRADLPTGSTPDVIITWVAVIPIPGLNYWGLAAMAGMLLVVVAWRLNGARRLGLGKSS